MTTPAAVRAKRYPKRQGSGGRGRETRVEIAKAGGEARHVAASLPARAGSRRAHKPPTELLARTDAQRQKDSYHRRKLGLESVRLDLPPDDLRRMLIKSGWLLRNKAEDFDNVRAAASEMMQALIVKILTT